MKQTLLTAGLILVCAAFFNAAEPPPAQDQQVAAMVKEVQAQQAKLAENQAAIDAKLATIAESVRVARIFASRGGR